MSNQEKNTERSKFEAKKGKEVAIDYFLYSCLETERTTKEMVESGTGQKISWPELQGQSAENLSGIFAEKKLKDLLREMTMWYRDNYPALSQSKALDHEVLLDVAEPLTALNKDYTSLYNLKINEDIPSFEASVGNNTIWEDIEEVLSIFFGSYKHLFIRYVIWSHGASPDEVFVPGSRPPIGKFAPRIQRDDRGSSARGNSRSGGGGGGNSKDNRGDRNGNRSSKPAPKGNERNPKSRDRNRPTNNKPQRSKEDTAKIEASALKDVTEAISKLDGKNGKESLDEIILKPANSFYRRLQHQRAVELGFDSFSVGEGKDRSVRIARKEDS